MLLRRGSAKKLHVARVAWLAAHPEAAVGVPGIHEDVTDEGRQRLMALHVQMTAAHLLGTSVIAIQYETIRRLVSELRGIGVGVGW